MSATHNGGNIQPSIDQEEHRSVNGVNTKAVAPYGFDGTNLVPLKVTSDGTLATNVTLDPGADNQVTGQVSVGATPTQIVATRTGRREVVIINLGNTQVFLGGSGVTSTTGLLLEGISGASIAIPSTAAIYGITATGSQSVSYMEIY